VVMGSAAGAVEETVDAMNAAGAKVGLIRVRLFHPFPAAALVAALPPSVRSIAVLDRTKEPGAVGEPLYLEVVSALVEAVDSGFHYQRPAGELQAVFIGLGSDGTVGANKSTVKIIGEHTDLYAQGYFVYDSKKSGSVTVSHLRFGPEPIRSTYLIDSADFVACHQFGLLETMKVLECAKPGATFLLNSPFGPDEVWDRLPREVQ